MLLGFLKQNFPNNGKSLPYNGKRGVLIFLLVFVFGNGNTLPEYRKTLWRDIGVAESFDCCGTDIVR
jgi:hypothetical protein